MNYPIWETTTIGGASLIALIAVLHVYISHLAVGGGAFIWLTDRKGFRDNDPQLHEYVRKHTWFFLLLTMVFGGLSGVGIWFIISLVHPAGTSLLIHNYVFGWAIEWVFFVGEIIALLVYHYQFDRLNRSQRMTLSFLYFLFAWLSLVIINGILSFMLTPGKWVETHNFWHGFFNPTYFSSVFFRTSAALMIAGLFGYVTSVFIKEEAFRNRMIRYCSKWLLYPMIGVVIGGIWYYFSIPEDIRIAAFGINPQTTAPVHLMIVATVLIFITGVLFSLRTSQVTQKALTFVLVIIGLGWMAGFEYTREVARKPFVVNKVLYSTSLLAEEAENYKQTGLLPAAKWSAVKEITPENKMAAGRELFNLQCLPCHTINGIRNDIVEKTAAFPYMGVMALITGQGKVNDYMPPFAGSQQELEVLAGYITSEINNKEIVAGPEIQEVQAKSDIELPPFSREDDYLVLAWNDLGMHCISDCDPWFVILPPANTIEAQVIKRGELPEIVTEGVELSYKVEPGFENPARHVEFWKYAKSNFGVDLEENVGLGGLGMSGAFQLDEDLMSFKAALIPVVPYSDNGEYNPYPLFIVEARDSETGELLASTRVVTPSSTEMGCRNCHGGGWRKGGAGVSDETAINILESHDRLSGTSLLKEARNGKPQICAGCHADPAVGAEGKPGHRSLSAAIHGWHANYMFAEGGEACAMCHPANPTGSTRCARGLHFTVGLSCVDCHGTLDEHAAALLKGEADKSGSDRMLRNLKLQSVSSLEEVNPRKPWENEPDCLTCHMDFEQPEPGVSGYNSWTESGEELYRNRTGNAGVRCSACHSSTHALYPARNAYAPNRDNTQPMQYAGQPYPIGANLSCETCHKQAMEFSVHHENMERTIRNQNL